WSRAVWDEPHFSIAALPGVLRLRPDADTAAGLWRAAADFEDPRDAGGDNTYDVVVVASAPGGATVAHRRHRHGDSRAGTADTDMIRCLTGWRACRQFGGNRAP
ncbi:MAG: hypothetical protein OXC00_14000, partial [Acidimicrobiaceae bacterium]|nr:hypothetical protein [Acidimicrobiaceae bacterium]